MPTPYESAAEIHPRFQGGSRLNTPGTICPQPLVSIVVVVFRDRAELGALLGNLTPFRGPEVELIIVDGGSKDGSLDLLQQQSQQIDYWLSEPDGGIYDAMNKGVAAARGQYILHINAGDRLLRLPLDPLSLLAERQIDVVCCRVLEDGVHLYTPRNGWLMRVDNPWHHQGTFYRRSAHLGYNPSYRVFGDFDHNQRLSKSTESVAMLETLVATHQTNGVSRNQKTRSEIFRSIRSNFGMIYLIPAFIRFNILRVRGALQRRFEGSKQG